MLRLLIAEDQAMLLTTLASLLDMEENISVSHCSSDGQDALDYLLDSDKESIDIFII